MYSSRGHVGVWHDAGHLPEGRTRPGPVPAAALSLDDGWWLHVPATSAGALYLRRLAAAADRLADETATPATGVS